MVSDKCLKATRLLMAILFCIGIVVLTLSVAALVWVNALSEIWTPVNNCDMNTNGLCRCVNNNCTTMNEKATSWHKFCFGGGIAGIPIGILCIGFGIVCGCLSNSRLKRRQQVVNTGYTT